VEVHKILWLTLFSVQIIAQRKKNEIPYFVDELFFFSRFNISMSQGTGVF